MKSVIYDLKDSFSTLITIIVYIGFYSVIGFYLFRGTFQGYANFPTVWNTYYQMTILLTTSNFPDIMLPAYN